jgi:hypothetical protein
MVQLDLCLPQFHPCCYCHTPLLTGFQGSTSALAALASQPQLAASVSLGIMMAPVAFTTGMHHMYISTVPLCVYGTLDAIQAVALL